MLEKLQLNVKLKKSTKTTCDQKLGTPPVGTSSVLSCHPKAPAFSFAWLGSDLYHVVPDAELPCDYLNGGTVGLFYSANWQNNASRNHCPSSFEVAPQKIWTQENVETQGHIWLTLNKCISQLQTMESMDIQACSSVRAPGMGTVPLQMHQFKATWIAQNGKAFHTVGVETASRWTSARGFSPILIHDNSIAVVFCLKIRARPLVTYGMSTNQCDLMLPGSEASIDLNTQWYFRIKAQIATPRPHLPPTDFRLSSEWPALRSSYASPPAVSSAPNMPQSDVHSAALCKVCLSGGLLEKNYQLALFSDPGQYKQSTSTSYWQGIKQSWNILKETSH